MPLHIQLSKAQVQFVKSTEVQLQSAVTYH